MAEEQSLTTVVWEGDSRDILQSFPRSPRHDLGYAIYRLQLGQLPPNSRPMQSIGQGVFELSEQDERAWYRVIYLKKIQGKLYVLHAFEKKSAKTSRTDLDVARKRLVNLNQRLKEEKREQS